MTKSELTTEIDRMLQELKAEHAAFIDEMEKIQRILESAEPENLSRGDFETLREEFQTRRHWKRDLNDRMMDLAERVAAADQERPGGLDEDVFEDTDDEEGPEE